jgi:hypothetical protein
VNPHAATLSHAHCADNNQYQVQPFLVVYLLQKIWNPIFYMLRRLTLSQIQFFVFDRFMKLSTVLDGFSASPTSRNVYSNEVIPMRHPTVGSIDLGEPVVKVDNELGGTSGDEDATKDTLNYSLFYDNGKTKTRRAEKDEGGGERATEAEIQPTSTSRRNRTNAQSTEN